MTELAACKKKSQLFPRGRQRTSPPCLSKVGRDDWENASARWQVTGTSRRMVQCVWSVPRPKQQIARGLKAARNGMRCVGGITEQAGGKVWFNTSGAKKPVLKQGLYRSVKNAAPPKTEFFHTSGAKKP